MLKRLAERKEKLRSKVRKTEIIEIEEAQAESEASGNFLSFILLDSKHYSIDQFIKDFKEDWNIDLKKSDIDHKENTNAEVFEQDGMLIGISYIAEAIPNDEAVFDSKANVFWQDSEKVAKQHQAHVILTVIKKDANILDAATLFAKIGASALKQENAKAINLNNTVISKQHYVENAHYSIHELKAFPIINLVFVGLYTSDNKTVSGYTSGLENFGKLECEILDSEMVMEDVHALLYDIAGYIITENVTLKAGETIGFSEEQKLVLEKTQGLAVTPSKLTIKINY